MYDSAITLIRLNQGFVPLTVKLMRGKTNSDVTELAREDIILLLFWFSQHIFPVTA